MDGRKTKTVMQIKLLHDDPYGEVITRYFATRFPKSIKPSSKELLEILTVILVGDKDIRLGPVPSPEQLVVIRSTIKKAIDMQLPIPILVAWGGRKTDAKRGVDVAELAALHQLMRLQDCIRTYYAPGIYVNIRIEDTGAWWIYKGEDNIDNNVEKYSSQFAKAVDMFAKDYCIYPIRESWLMDKKAYFNLSGEYSGLLSDVITAKVIEDTKGGGTSIQVIPAMKELEDKGWKGGLPMDQINHYIERYKVLYPDKNMSTYIEMAADYLGGAKARYDMDGRGAPKSEVGSYVGISFIPPIPGAPASMFNNTLYYRTVPMSDGRTHIAPWRAKGYLEIAVDNTIKTKVTSWSNKELIEQLQPVTLQFIDKGEEILIDADYISNEFVMPFII